MTTQPSNRRVLISTIEPISGGVPTMTRFIAGTLSARGLTPVLAHYEPYSRAPRLSVPSFRLGRSRPSAEQRRTWERYETHAIGAWLPELEFTTYWPTPAWRRVMDSCAAQVMVSGNVLAATPYLRTGRPYVAWVATGWDEDRKDRTAAFPWPRKLLDSGVNAPVIRRLESRLLRAGTILALSTHTRRTLEALAGGKPLAGVLPMPVETELFTPRPAAVVPGRIGFSGRLDEARKNLGLLLSALSLANQAGAKLRAWLIGGPASPEVCAQINALGLEGQVTILPYAPREQLRDHLQSLDLFVIPSHQEGLCIAALEAMACGCPVVSTRCGGPEEFVIAGETGQLVDFDPAAMAQALGAIVQDRALRDRLAQGARRRIEQHYHQARAEGIFWQAFTASFPTLAASYSPFMAT